MGFLYFIVLLLFIYRKKRKQFKEKRIITKLMSRRPQQVQPHHHSHHNSNNESSPSPTRRYAPITTARRRFGAKVNLGALGPGNERVVASELLLIDAAGGAPVIFDVTRSSIPFPHEQLFQYQQKEITKQIQDPYSSKPETKKEIVLVEKEREA